MREVSSTTLPPEIIPPPQNIDAEQALLGALLINNAALDRCAGIVDETHFSEPLHGRIFSTIEREITAGRKADPVRLKDFFTHEPPIVEKPQPVTVAQYLGRLAASATSIINARDYAITIRDLANRREMILIGEDLGSLARNLDEPAIESIEMAEAQLFNVAQHDAGTVHEYTAKEASAIAIDMIANAYQRDSHLAGDSTGFKDLDRILGGLVPSDLIIIAGRPSMGKSALASNIAFNYAARLLRDYEDATAGGKLDLDGKGEGERKKPSMGEVSFYSLEMSAEQIMLREISRESGIAGERLRRGQINEDGRGDAPPAHEFSRKLIPAAEKLGKYPIHIDATGGLKLAQFVARARRRKRLHDTRLIVVDYLQLMTASRAREGRVAEVSEITVALKAIAKELNVPVIALSQLSRAVEQRENKRPQLSDLRESGSIEQDADVVMFVYREEYYLKRTEPRVSEVEEHQAWQAMLAEVSGQAEAILGKHRHAPINTALMAFHDSTASFADLAEGR